MYPSNEYVLQAYSSIHQQFKATLREAFTGMYVIISDPLRID